MVKESESKTWHRITIDGVEGWFVPDGATTPPQVFCKDCQFIIAQRKHYAKLCREVNKRFGGIAGVTKGINGTLPSELLSPKDLTL